MTEREKKDIERQVHSFMVSLDAEFPDIPTDDIFSLVMAKASKNFVESLDEKYKVKALREFYPEDAKNLADVFKETEK